MAAGFPGAPIAERSAVVAVEPLAAPVTNQAVVVAVEPLAAQSTWQSAVLAPVQPDQADQVALPTCQVGPAAPDHSPRVPAATDRAVLVATPGSVAGPRAPPQRIS